MLFLVSTPIGNLADFSLRAIETLKKSDYILCEDTRHSRILLNHYGIKKPLRSYHKFNEASSEERIISDLKRGKKISLISDAGTPGISDPGSRLVKRCHKENFSVSNIPGPCAAISALCCSGLPTNRFQFLGFLPKKKNALLKMLQEINDYPGTTICYESPKRLLKVLDQIATEYPNLIIVIARELTKKFEEMISGTAHEMIEIFSKKSLKGEIILLFSKK